MAENATTTSPHVLQIYTLSQIAAEAFLEKLGSGFAFCPLPTYLGPMASPSH